MLGKLGLINVVFSLTHGQTPLICDSKGQPMEAVPFSIDPTSAMNLVTVVHNNDEAVDPTRNSVEADANA